jgi:transposase
MPAPYSLDLRKKAVLACENGEYTQKEIAEQFSIGYRTLKEWLFLKKTTGDVNPKEHVHRGPLPVIDEKGLSYIKELVDKKPDILISEIRELYSKKFKVEILSSMVSKSFKKLNLRRKKKSGYASEQDREDIKKNEKNGKKK